MLGFYSLVTEDQLAYNSAVIYLYSQVKGDARETEVLRLHCMSSAPQQIKEYGRALVLRLH